MNCYFESSKGNVLSQYGIIIGLIALAIIPASFFLGKNIVQQLAYLGDGLSGGSTTEANSSATPSITPTGNGTITNTSDVKKNCSGNTCSITIGDFEFTKVPDNFGEFIETAGASGGTDVLVELLKQIAESPAITAQESDILKKLANKGHDLAEIEEIIEVQAKLIIDENLTPDKKFEDNGEELKQKMNAFNLQYAQVSHLISANPDARALVDVLVNQIGGLATDMSLAHQVAINSCVTEGSCSTDVLTGATVETEPYTNSMGDIITPEAASVTDLDSSLICATGDGSDTGTECK